MLKKIVSVSLASAIVLGSSVQAYAAPESSATSNIQENKAKYKELGNEILNLNSQLSDLNVQIDNLNSQINSNKEKMTETTNNINATQSKIDNVQKQIGVQQQLLGVRLAAMYKNEVDFNPIAFLIASNSLSDFFSRLEAYRKIIALDDNLISSLNNNKKALDTDMNNLNSTKAELNNLQTENEKNLATLNEKKQNQTEMVDKLNSERTSVLSVITENENSLISYSVSIINSSSSTIAQLKSAVASLNNILPQLSVDSVIQTANNAISSGNSKITKLESEATKPSSNNTSNNSTNSGDSAHSNSNGSTTNNSNASGSNSNSNNSSSSGTSQYKQVLQMTATAYTGGTLTAMGLKPVRNPDGMSTIAVDPSVIPLGSKVYIPGYGYAIASDTGGAIKGNIIDLYMNSESACNSWGRRPVTVYVVAYPGQW